MTRTLNSSTLTLDANNATLRTVKSTKPVTTTQVVRLIVRKWDMAAVIALMMSCGAYGLYSLTQMTGF